MAKRSAKELNELTFTLESGKDGVEYKCGCDCGGDNHGGETEWIECTENKCDIWYCINYIQQEFDLNDEEMDQVKDHPDLFKCEAHGLTEIDFKKLLGSDGQSCIGYNLRKRQKIDFKDCFIESEKENEADLDEEDIGDLDFEDDDLKKMNMELEELNQFNIQQDLKRVRDRVRKEQAAKAKAAKVQMAKAIKAAKAQMAKAAQAAKAKAKGRKGKKKKETKAQMNARSMSCIFIVRQHFLYTYYISFD